MTWTVYTSIGSYYEVSDAEMSKALDGAHRFIRGVANVTSSILPVTKARKAHIAVQHIVALEENP